MIRNIITAASLAIAGISLTAAAHAGGVEATTEVPAWMTHQCEQEDSVNCHWDGGTYKPKQGEAFFREMPGRKHMVCVLFINTPRRDYCS